MAKQMPPQPMTAPSFPSPGTGGSVQMPGKVVSKGDTYQGQSVSRGNSLNGAADAAAPKGVREGTKREEAFDRGVVSKQSHAPAPHREKKMRGANY